MVRRYCGRHLGVFVLTLLAALVLARSAGAQTISGTVKDAQGKPVEGASVKIDSTEVQRHFETKTGKDGSYVQVGIVSGMYTVTVEKGDLKAQRTLMLRQGTPNTVNFTLSPAGASADPKIQAMQKAFEEGLDASKAGNQDEAITKFEAAIAIVPNCADCYFNIGFAQAQKKDFEKAEAAYKKAIEIKPNYSEAYTGLANIYNAQRKFDEAAAASAK